MTLGYVYICQNIGFPGRYKIGKTSRRPDERIAELQAHYGTIHPFTKVKAYMVPDYSRVEAYVHRRLRSRRDYKTEMFVCTREEAIAAVLWAHDEVSKLRIAPRPQRAPNAGAGRGSNRKSGNGTLSVLALLVLIGWLVHHFEPEIPDWLPAPILRTGHLLERPGLVP
jgi:hypothetical protein